MAPKPTKKKSEGNEPDTTRQLLIDAAKSVFADKGYEGSTVKDIADAAGVNISLVSYHFDGKENLYRICLETFANNHIAAAERALKSPANREEFKLVSKCFLRNLSR